MSRLQTIIFERNVKVKRKIDRIYMRQVEVILAHQRGQGFVYQTQGGHRKDKTRRHEQILPLYYRILYL